MPRLRRSTLLAFVAALVLSCRSAGSLPPPATAGAALGPGGANPDVTVELRPEITRAELEGHVRFLASDQLEGRRTGTPAADRAARYLAAVLAQSGVKPAGDGGGYLQAVPLIRPRATRLPEVTVTDDQGATRSLVVGADFQVRGASFEVSDLPIVVVKTEQDLPRAADPRTAVFLDAGGAERQRWLEKAGLAAPGAFALVIGRGASRRLAPATLETLDLGLRRASRATDAGAARPTILLHGPALDDLRSGRIRRISAVGQFQDEAVTSYNVVGKIPGRGTADRPQLGQEAIVMSAHYDHLGSMAPAASPPAPPDLVFNGADDDASGTAAVLEVAAAVAAGPPPARTLVVLLATAEEIGLFGTEEYLDRPVVPLKLTVLNLNFEMIGRPDEKVGGPGVLWLTGYPYTNLGAALAGAGLGSGIKADPRPEHRFFERSDNYAFVRRGVVGQTLSSYNMHSDYHRPSDEADKLDYGHMESAVRAALAAARLVADGTITPQWTAEWQPRR